MLARNHDEMGHKMVASMGCAPMSVRLKVCDNNYYTTRHQIPMKFILKPPDFRPLIHRHQRKTRPDKAQSFLIACPLLGIVIRIATLKELILWVVIFLPPLKNDSIIPHPIWLVNRSNEKFVKKFRMTFFLVIPSITNSTMPISLTFVDRWESHYNPSPNCTMNLQHS